MNTNKDKLIKEITSLLNNKESLDYTNFLKYANELVQFDKNNVRFSVDAGVINRLGKELVARHETAVAELVKNAYDADATTVDITFEDSYKLGGKLTIVDNGHGMTRDQLINGYMRISSTDKIHNPVSPKFNRRRAGRKGIGRFATQRLGNKLTIITQTEISKKAIKVEIDWNDFELDKDLFSISNIITEIPGEEGKTGTTLIIDDLRDTWTDFQITKVYRYASEIIQPFPLSKIEKTKEKERKEKQIDPGFKANFYKVFKGESTLIADEESMFFKHALADIEGFVDEKGNGFYTIVSKKLKIDEFLKIGKDKDNEDSPYNELRNIHFKVYYFIYDPELIPKQIFTMIREAGNKTGGIKLYKNGFRTLPYGELQNDWLGLDESFRRRVILAAHGNNNFFGFVEIKEEKENEQFIELSSREGFLENETYKELVDFIYRAIIASVRKVAEVRKRKQTASQRDWKKREKPSEKIKEIAKKINSLDISSQEGIKKKQQITFDLLKTAEESDEFERQYINENSLLRVLAGLGLTMAEFLHEIENYIASFGAGIANINEYTKGQNKLNESLNELRYNYNTFSTYTSYFNHIISRNISREIEPIEIRDSVNNFLDVIKRDIERADITVEKPEYNGYDLFTTPMHPSEMASILFNFYTNSKKAIKKANRKGRIFIRSGKEDNIIYFEFHDNGIGIPDENKEKIFDAFFTTSIPVGHTALIHEEILGSGLGLKIVKDIVNSYNGEIFVKEPDKDFKTCIRIEIPAATNEEMKEYDL